MADYPNITKRSQLDVTTPEVGTAPISELDDAIRQIKSFLSVYLALAFDDDGNLKDGAVTSAKLADAAVSAANLGSESVTAAKLAPEAVETAKIKDEAVTTAKFAAGYAFKTMMARFL